MAVRRFRVTVPAGKSVRACRRQPNEIECVVYSPDTVYVGSDHSVSDRNGMPIHEGVSQVPFDAEDVWIFNGGSHDVNLNVFIRKG